MNKIIFCPLNFLSDPRSDKKWSDKKSGEDLFDWCCGFNAGQALI